MKQESQNGNKIDKWIKILISIVLLALVGGVFIVNWVSILLEKIFN